MKHSRPNTLRPLLATLFAVALAACGGGGGGASPAPSAAATPPPPPAEPEPIPVPGSTRLGDNPVGGDASFDNFSTAKPTIPVSGIGFTGSQIYVKINRIDGEVLFLGAVSSDRDFVVPVHLPTDETRLLYEIFSDSASDQIIFGEISL
ncbi:MAG: hypothetical protein JSW21_05435 [Gammaproteobacteria bacterium]|nr:MAG: hypothetical protein JSW21_05435 [Gammaproteobacteria bacterium]